MFSQRGYHFVYWFDCWRSDQTGIFRMAIEADSLPQAMEVYWANYHELLEQGQRMAIENIEMRIVPDEYPN